MFAIPSAQIVTLTVLATLTGGTAFSSVARGEIYRIDLKDRTKTLLTRTIDTAKPSAGAHAAGGIAFEVADTDASCGVFIQPQVKEASVRTADVMVSLVENRGAIESRTVVSNSGLLSKRAIPETEKDVLPKSAGNRSVSVDAPKLRRSCTVSVL